VNKVIQLKRPISDDYITYVPENKPPIETAVFVYCKGCKKKHLLYPVYDEDTYQIGWWWCFNLNEPFRV